MENDDLPKDLTFTDPAVSTRPLKLPVPSGPKKDEVSTPMGKVRDFDIGVLLLVSVLEPTHPHAPRHR